jgi:hypothetical protein
MKRNDDFPMRIVIGEIEHKVNNNEELINLVEPHILGPFFIKMRKELLDGGTSFLDATDIVLAIIEIWRGGSMSMDSNGLMTHIDPPIDKSLIEFVKSEHQRIGDKFNASNCARMFVRYTDKDYQSTLNYVKEIHGAIRLKPYEPVLWSRKKIKRSCYMDTVIEEDKTRKIYNEIAALLSKKQLNYALITKTLNLAKSK